MKTKVKIAILACLIIIVVIIVRGILFFTAEPKITVDYLSQYNKLTKPNNYDSNENAADYYQKAYDTFVKIPKEIQEDLPYINWPTDFNSTDQNVLRYWLNSNRQAFDYFRMASSKPYYWVKRNSRDDSGLAGIYTMPELDMRNLTDSVLWNAKLNASEGQFGEAFEDTLMCRRAAQHLCRAPSFLIEQTIGLRIKQKLNADVFEILSKLKVDNTDLQVFQSALEKEIAADKYKPDFEAEKLFCYDELQRNFVYNTGGTGRLALKKLKYFLDGDKENQWKVLLTCFTGPTRNEIAKNIEAIFTSLEPTQTMTPWQIHRKAPNYFDRIDASIRDDFFLRMYVQNPSDIFRLYNHTKAQEQGVITIIAILRFRNDNHKLPDSFDELVSSGYLQSLPLDPYSNGALVYRPKGDSFALYSVGENFEDDGGKDPDKAVLNPSGDIVFWPVKRNEQRMKRLDESKEVNTPAKF
jgi:hypothetical protein